MNSLWCLWRVWGFRTTWRCRWSCTCLSSERAGRRIPHRTLWCSCTWKTLGKSCRSPWSHSGCSPRWQAHRHKVRATPVTQPNTRHILVLSTARGNDSWRGATTVESCGRCWKHWLVFLQLLKVCCVPLRALKNKWRSRSWDKKDKKERHCESSSLSLSTQIF